MLLYYFDEDTQKVEEICVKKVVVGVEHTTVTTETNHFKLIKTNKLLYIVEDNL